MLPPRGVVEKARTFILFGFVCIITSIPYVINEKRTLFFAGLLLLVLTGCIFFVLGLYFAYGSSSVIIDKHFIYLRRGLLSFVWEKKYPIHKTLYIQEEMAYIHKNQVRSVIAISIESKLRPFMFGGYLPKKDKILLIQNLKSFLNI